MQTMLIADDEPAIRSLVKMTLTSDLYRIIEASDGNEALELIKEHRPELVFLDVSMPGLSGFEVCRQVKADPELETTKVVMLTAKAQEVDLEKGRSVGADDYFTKPFSPVNLLRKVDEVFSGGDEPHSHSEGTLES